MKKVKIFFTAVAVLAVVGGAVAFKSAKTGGNLKFCNTSNVCAADMLHSSVSGIPITNPGTLYVAASTVGVTCGQPGCNTKFTGNVFSVQ